MMTALLLIALGLGFGACGTNKKGTAVRPELKELLAAPQPAYTQVLSASQRLSDAEAMWLIEKLVSENTRTRGAAAYALSNAGQPGAAAAFYLAIRSESDEVVRNTLVMCLGKMGVIARRYLEALIAEEGISPLLAGAYAQSHGVAPYGSGNPFVEGTDGLVWWERTGRRLFAEQSRRE